MNCSTVKFTARELEFIRLLCKELTTKEIAYELGVCTRSVDEYCKRVKEKTRTVSIVGIAIYAINNDLL